MKPKKKTIKNRTENAILKYPVTKPIIAKTLPPTMEGFALILARDLCPQMTAGIPVKNPQKTMLRIPQTKLAMARPSVVAAVPGAIPEVLCGVVRGAAVSGAVAESAAAD